MHRMFFLGVLASVSSLHASPLNRNEAEASLRAYDMEPLLRSPRLNAVVVMSLTKILSEERLSAIPLELENGVRRNPNEPHRFYEIVAADGEESLGILAFDRWDFFYADRLRKALIVLLIKPKADSMLVIRRAMGTLSVNDIVKTDFPETFYMARPRQPFVRSPLPGGCERQALPRQIWRGLR